MPAPRSLVSWPQLVDIATTVLPFLGAWAAGRLSWRDPVGLVGITWGVLFVNSLVQLGAVLTGERVLLRAASIASMLLLPLLLTPALLTWIGPAAARWQRPLAATFAIVGIGALVAFGGIDLVLVPGLSRRFTLFYHTPSHLALALLALGMLVAQARRAADPRDTGVEPGWLWIGGGHLIYFLATVVGRPLIEFLVPQGRDPTRDAIMGLMLIYSTTMLAITWGLWLGRRTVTRPPHASRATIPATTA
ncbi:MAG: hypothetical protein ACXW61_11370 [Gemmatirosa sp.]